jgi:hypothetical protein
VLDDQQQVAIEQIREKVREVEEIKTKGIEIKSRIKWLANVSYNYTKEFFLNNKREGEIYHYMSQEKKIGQKLS